MPTAVASRQQQQHHHHLDLKPLLRGVFHQWAALVAAVAGVVLVVLAPVGGARLAAGVYAVCITTMLTVSALYHRVGWSPSAHSRMRQADHCGIFLAIAGTYTPVVALGLHGWIRPTLLITVWTAAAIGILFEWLPFEPPRGYVTAIYVTMGWVCGLALPVMWSQIGATTFLLVLAGGILYTVGAFVHAFRWPDPVPHVFGYHEVWHLFVIAAAGFHYVAVLKIILDA